MKTQNLELANTSGYRAPELYELGNLDKVQGYYIFGYYYDWYNWLIWY